MLHALLPLGTILTAGPQRQPDIPGLVPNHTLYRSLNTASKHPPQKKKKKLQPRHSRAPIQPPVSKRRPTRPIVDSMMGSYLLSTWGAHPFCFESETQGAPHPETHCCFGCVGMFVCRRAGLRACRPTCVCVSACLRVCVCVCVCGMRICLCLCLCLCLCSVLVCLCLSVSVCLSVLSVSLSLSLSLSLCDCVCVSVSLCACVSGCLRLVVWPG